MHNYSPSSPHLVAYRATNSKSVEFEASGRTSTLCELVRCLQALECVLLCEMSSLISVVSVAAAPLLGKRGKTHTIKVDVQKVKNTAGFYGLYGISHKPTPSV